MSFLRSVFTGVVGMLVFLVLWNFWSSWTVDEVSTFRTAFHGGVTPPPKFVCNTHFAADAGKTTLDWRCDVLNAVCRHGVQSACERIAAFTPDPSILTPHVPGPSRFADPAFEKQLLGLTPKATEGTSLGIQRKVYGGSIDDIPHITPAQLARDRSDDAPTAANPNSPGGNRQ